MAIIPSPEEGIQHPHSDERFLGRARSDRPCKGEEIGARCKETMSVDSRDLIQKRCQGTRKLERERQGNRAVKAKEPTLEQGSSSKRSLLTPE